MKKYLLLLLMISAQCLTAQIKGNNILGTRTFEISDITSLEIGLYADVVVHQTGKSQMVIKAETNLFDYIGMNIENGQLTLDQIEWIQPGMQIKIEIQAPSLSKLVQSTHETTLVDAISGEIFHAEAQVGKIILTGQVEELSAEAGVGMIDATKLTANQVNATLQSWGSIALASPGVIKGMIQSGTLSYKSDKTKVYATVSGDGKIRDLNSSPPASETEKTRYIDLKIKNNSWKRLEAYVIGPKPDGKIFSYGFPLRAGQVRKERWTIGTKIYRKTALGTKNLLIKIQESDEGKVVDLHRNTNNQQ